MTDTIFLTGLPGAGKTRFKQAFKQAFPAVSVCELAVKEELSLSMTSPKPLKVWCVIDVRSKLDNEEAEQVLTQMLTYSSGVILSFVDQADLAAQSFWQTWLADHIDSQRNLPRFRWFSTGLLSDWDWQIFGQALSGEDTSESLASRFSLEDYQSMDFVYDYAQGAKVMNLEHLLLGLDASKQNLGMKIWRVQGVVKTTEYVNPVAIEGTVNRWDTFAGELINDSGWLRIEGLDLDKTWIQQIIDAGVL